VSPKQTSSSDLTRGSHRLYATQRWADPSIFHGRDSRFRGNDNKTGTVLIKRTVPVH